MRWPCCGRAPGMLHRPRCWSPCPQTELRSYRPSNFMLSRASCISSMPVQAGPGRTWQLSLRGTLLRETHGAAAHTVARSPDTARDPEGRAHPRLHRRLLRPVRNGAIRNRVPCVCSGIHTCPGSLPGPTGTPTPVSFVPMCHSLACVNAPTTLGTKRLEHQPQNTCSRVCHDPTTMNMCSIGYRLQIIASRVWFHFLACACHNPSCSNPQGCSS